MNLLPATLTEGGAAARLAGGALWRFADGARPGGEGCPVTIGIRPEHLLRDGGEGLALSVDLAEPLGSETVLHGRLADGTLLTARVPGALATEAISLAPEPGALHVFDRQSGRRIDPG
jgi:sn-glycerol 3-phosphate transport system ATP-binding protein